MAPSTSTSFCLSASLDKLMASLAFRLHPVLARVIVDASTKPKRARSFIDVSPFPSARRRGRHLASLLAGCGGRSKERRAVKIHPENGCPAERFQPSQSKRMHLAKSRAKERPFRHESPRFFGGRSRL